MTAVLVSRFLLDLQGVNDKTLLVDTEHPLHFDSQSFGEHSFARVIGSMGSHIVAGA